MTTLIAWLRSKNWSTHTIGVSVIGVATFIATDQQAKQYLVGLLQAHPALAVQVIALAGLIAAYKKSSSPAGTLAQAAAIVAGPNPPSASQIQAATVNPASAQINSKTTASIFVLALALSLALSGCKQVNAPLPAWAPNAQIAFAGSVISSAVSVVNGYEQDQKDCSATPTLAKCPGVSNVAIHAAVQKIQETLVIAQPAFNQWKAALATVPATTEPAQLVNSVSTIQSSLAQLPALAQ